MNSKCHRWLLSLLTVVSGLSAQAHDATGEHSREAVATNWLPMRIERKGPMAAAAPLPRDFAGKISGQGCWRFMAATNLLPLPPEVAGKVTPAHGTLIVDAERDVVYWGLKKVGWVGFSNRLRDSWVVDGDEAFTHHNLHGADLLPRKGKLPLVAVADNEGYKIHLTDTTFRNPQTLPAPDFGPYGTNQTYRPTDVAFTGAERLFVTDGYARHYVMPIKVSPLAYEGTAFGGNSLSQTPHGITWDVKDRTLLISARPEGQAKRWSVAKSKLTAIAALPAGTLLCDVDLWKEYALAACLEGPNKSPGPLMILNLKRKTIASIIKPKEELGYEFCEHIHDAAWYVVKNGRRTEVYLLFTSWNPGGIGALKLVNVPD